MSPNSILRADGVTVAPSSSQSTDAIPFDTRGTPVLDIQEPAGTQIAAFDVPLVWNYAVSGFTASDLSIAPSGLTSTFSGSGANYNVNIIPPVNATGNISLSVPANALASGHPQNAATNSMQIPYDTRVATPNITDIPTQTVTEFDIGITWTGVGVTAVTGFEASDISYSDNDITTVSLTGSGLSYTLRVRVPDTSTGSFSVIIDANVLTSPLRSNSLGSNSYSYNTITDNVPPTGTWSVPSTTQGGAYDATFNFSEDITTSTVAATDFSVSAGTFTLGTVATRSAQLRVTPPDDTLGSITCTIAANAVTDLHSNTGPTSAITSSATPFDTQDPHATFTYPSGVQVGDTIEIGVTWSEDVGTSFVVGDLIGENTPDGGTAGSLAVSLSGSGANYVITIAKPSGSGLVRVRIGAGTVSDSHGNTNAEQTTQSIRYSEPSDTDQSLRWYTIPTQVLNENGSTRVLGLSQYVNRDDFDQIEFVGTPPSWVTLANADTTMAQLSIDPPAVTADTHNIAVLRVTHGSESDDVDVYISVLNIPTPTAQPPEIRTIPTLDMKPGETRTFAMDQYVEGMVTNMSLSSSANWISLGSGMAQNRTLTIAPPANFSPTSPFQTFSSTVTATNTAGSDSAMFYVNVYPLDATPAPLIEPIPVTVLAPGDTRTISLDQYVSGDVNDDGITISGQPSWVTLGAGMGVNRTISIAPPSTITDSTQYYFTLSAEGSGGTTTQRVTIYVDVEPSIPTITETVEVLRWGSWTYTANTRTYSINVTFDRDIVELVAADYTFIGEGTISQGTITEVNDSTYTIQAVVPNNATGEFAFVIRSNSVTSAADSNVIGPLYDTYSPTIDYDTTSTPTPAPDVRQIPTVVLSPGDTKVFSLDEYIFGNVSTITMSASATWISLGTGVGQNRDLTIAPPASFTPDNPFSDFTATLTITGSGGTATMDIDVYVMRTQSMPTPNPTMEVESWTVPTEVQLGATITATATFTHDVDPASIATTDFVTGDSNITVASFNTSADVVTLTLNVADDTEGYFAIRVLNGSISSTETDVDPGPTILSYSPSIDYNRVPDPSPDVVYEMDWNLPDGTQTASTNTLSVNITPKVSQTVAQIRTLCEIEGVDVDVTDDSVFVITKDDTDPDFDTFTFVVSIPDGFVGTWSIGIDDDGLTNA